MKETTFSIIIPCYNLEKYIHNTIESLLNQTFRNFEIILVDDGSKDNTGKIITEYSKKDSRIKVISKVNEGVSEARNTGLRAAIGKYIYFLDGDDRVENNLLEEAAKIFKNKEIKIFAFGFDIVSESGELKKRCSFEKYNGLLINSKKFLSLVLKKEIRVHLCSFIIEKDFLQEKIYFTKGMSRGEDLEFQIKFLLEDVPLFYDKRPFFKYTIRIGSVIQNKVKINIFDFLVVMEKIMEEDNNKEIRGELKYFFVMYYFYIIKEIAQKDFDNTIEFNEIKRNLKRYDYILNDIKFEKKYFKIKLLIILYKVDVKVLIVLFKVLSKFNI